MGRRIVLCAACALFGFAAIWGVYIMVLSFSAHSGEASYPLAISIAMLLQLLLYKTAGAFKLSRLCRWVTCSAAMIPLMLLMIAVFKGSGNFELIGSGFNPRLLAAFCCFAFVTGIYELGRRVFLGKAKPEEPDTPAEAPPAEENDKKE